MEDAKALGSLDHAVEFPVETDWTSWNCCTDNAAFEDFENNVRLWSAWSNKVLPFPCANECTPA